MSKPDNDRLETLCRRFCAMRSVNPDEVQWFAVHGQYDYYSLWMAYLPVAETALEVLCPPTTPISKIDLLDTIREFAERSRK